MFFFKWTVNWKFLDEEFFVSKSWAAILLVLHFTALGVLVFKFVQKRDSSPHGVVTTPHRILLIMFSANFIGVVFARTLHYQFYSWYFHSLPFLLWRTRLPLLVKVAVLVVVEIAFNIFPATPSSSALLQIAHCVLLVALLGDPATMHNPDEQIVESRRKALLRAKDKIN